MREVDAEVVVLLNPEDAATHPDGTFGGLPVVADPRVPPGFARFRYEMPDSVDVEPGEPLIIRGVAIGVGASG